MIRIFMDSLEIRISTAYIIKVKYRTCTYLLQVWLCWYSFQNYKKQDNLMNHCCDIWKNLNLASWYFQITYFSIFDSKNTLNNRSLSLGFWRKLGTMRTEEFVTGTYNGRGKFMPLPLKIKILETPGSLVTDDIKMLPLWIWTLNLQASLMVQYELLKICNYSATCPQSEQT